MARTTPATHPTQATPATQTSRDILPGHGDLVRVVPLYIPDELVRATPGIAAGPSPHLTYRGGPLLASVQVYTIFWGAAWQKAPLSQTATTLNQFFDDILASALLDQLAEYDVAGYTIDHGQRIGTTTITTPKPGATLTDTAAQHHLQHWIATDTSIPQPAANLLYFLFLPPGVRSIQGGGSSCRMFCGYHNDIGGQIFYAVMPYPGCAGCLGGLSVLDALTSTSSHELCEAITDPIPGRGWYDDVHFEIGDICAWQTKQVAGHTVQQEWSNAQNHCV